MAQGEVSGRVVVVGSLNTDFTIRVTDLPRPGETVLGADLVVGPGGKGANQAVAARRAGAACTLIGAIGSDEAGSALRANLIAQGVDSSALVSIDGAASGVAMIVVNAEGQNAIAVAPGANGHLSGDGVRSAIGRLTLGPNTVLLTSHEISDDAVIAATSAAKDQGWETILNPAPYRPIAPLALSHTDILTPNELEADDLLAVEPGTTAWLDIKRRPERRVRELLRSGLQALVVTLGSEGALVITANEWHHVPAPRVNVVDSTGAGDVFNGVFAAARAKGGNLVAAVELAVAAAGASTTKPQAQTATSKR